MKRYLILVFIGLFFGLHLYGQDTICDCCLDGSLYWTDEFEDYFSPKKISSDNVRVVTIFLTPQALNTPVIDSSKHREMMLVFNKNGYVLTQIHFNEFGKHRSARYFTRDSNNRITERLLHYLDDHGTKLQEHPWDHWKYYYSGNQLTKIRRVDQDLANMPDSKSHYEKYKYDKNGRRIYEYRYSYYDSPGEKYIFASRVKFNDKEKSSISTMTYNGKPFLRIQSKYNEAGIIINSRYFSKLEKSHYLEMTFEYNNSGQIIKQEVVSLTGGGECPASYTDKYFYKDGLIEKIEHTTNKSFCLLEFKYD